MVLDIGTGTGILAILSSKLGARNVLGIDIDDDSVRIAKENVEVNDCFNVDIRKGNLLNKINYEADIVVAVANITADIIIKMVSQLASVLKNGGIFISSGILATKADNVRTALVGNNFEIVETLIKGEWAGITARLK